MRSAILLRTEISSSAPHRRLSSISTSLHRFEPLAPASSRFGGLRSVPIPVVCCPLCRARHTVRIPSASRLFVGALQVVTMALHVKSLSSAAPVAVVSKIGLSNGKTTLLKTPSLPIVQHSASRLVAVRAETEEKALTGLVFEPFREVQSQTLQLPESPHESLARQRFETSCESAINTQINVEYNASYIYHSLFSYFDRDNVALPGLAKYFQDSSAEEREHAEKFMQYQNKRGGRVKLQSIILPPMEFNNVEKGDALNAMEVTLSLEKLTTEKLYALHKAAEEADDIQLQDYVEEFLAEQIEEIKKVSTYVAQLRRIGLDGHGVYHWDRELAEEAD